MMNELRCERAEELFSDHLDGSLSGVLKAELERHLGACERCRALHSSVGLVVDLLRSDPGVEPSEGLSARVAAAAIARGRAAGAPWRGFAVPSWLQAAAGFAAIALGLAFMASSSRLTTAASTVARLRERTVQAGAFLAERRERALGDFQMLRAVIGTAFEGRLDRVNERVDDYRRLLEQRRTSDRPAAPAGVSALPARPRSATPTPSSYSSNQAGLAFVDASVGRPSGRSDT
jgi:anti-sigma factor RsiW